jgi:ATP-dependent Clp protease ATP-binding subunit ClpA
VGISRNEIESENDIRTEMMNELKQFLRPEFINRLDDVVIFKRLVEEDLKKIVQIQVSDLTRRLAEMLLTLNFQEAAIDYIIKTSDTANYGARPLKRRIETLVENKIASLLISPAREKAKGIVVSFKDNEVKVEFVKK